MGNRLEDRVVELEKRVAELEGQLEVLVRPTLEQACAMHSMSVHALQTSEVKEERPRYKLELRVLVGAIDGWLRAATVPAGVRYRRAHNTFYGVRREDLESVREMIGGWAGMPPARLGDVEELP